MAGPSLRRVDGGDFSEAPDWFKRFLDTVNPFFNDTTSALAGGLDRSNFRRQLETFRIDTQATLSSTFSDGKIRIKNKLGVPPREVRVGQIYPVGFAGLDDQWHAPTLLNSWVNWGATASLAGYMKDAMGFVHLRGSVKTGAVPSIIFTLPTGYRPSKDETQITISNDLLGRCDIVASTGAVTASIGNTAWYQLDGITFKADDSTSSASVMWELQNSGLINITWINGLAPSKSYDVTLVIE